MTECKREKCDSPIPTLLRLRRQSVELDFKGGTLTSDAGLLLLREADRRINLISRLDKLINDPRDQRFVTHTQAEMLTSRIFGIAAGYEDANDHNQLRHDAAFQVAAGRAPAENNYDNGNAPLASSPTLSRLENRVDRKACVAIQEALVDIFLESYATEPDEIILDYDATDDQIHGEQEGRHFNGFYDGYCYLPLYIFCGDHLLVSYLRSAKYGAAHHCRAITKFLVAKIRQRWPKTKIILRGDSAYGFDKLMRWCDKNNVGYVFGFQTNEAVTKLIGAQIEEAKKGFEESQEKTTVFTWFRYKARGWKKYRWMIGKASHCSKGTSQRFVATNLPSSEGVIDVVWGRKTVEDHRIPFVKDPGQPCSVARNPKEFYNTMYCARGEMENKIKEQQLYLFADRTSCKRFIANQFRLLLSSAAYVLVDAIRRVALCGTKQARWRVDTIRLQLIKIAARVTVSCRRVVFHLASHCPSAQVFNNTLKRLCFTG